MAGFSVVLENDAGVVVEVEEDSNIVVLALKPLAYLNFLSWISLVLHGDCSIRWVNSQMRVSLYRASDRAMYKGCQQHQSFQKHGRDRRLARSISTQDLVSVQDMKKERV